MAETEKRSREILSEMHARQTGIGFQEVDSLAGGDLGDETYRNFIVYADYSDPDVIRVGEDFYAVSSTFHLSPGITILHSRDLVNWEIAGHAVEDLSKLHPDFSFQAMNGYAKGIWAPSIRYHEQKFYIYVGGPDIGLIVCKADCIQGPWKVKRLKLKSPWKGNMLIDCCPLWDDDGKAYFAAAEPRWYNDYTVPDYRMFLFRMSPDGEELLDDGVVVHGGRTTEAVKLYKINSMYYIFYCEHPMDENGMRTQFCARSKSIYGPYERKKLIHSHAPEKDLNPSQGGLVEAGDGRWWFLCHGMNEGVPAASIGRPLALLPVTWVEDWPMIGEDPDHDGVGEMAWRAGKPIQGFPASFPQSSDEFDADAPGPQWQWNHSPRNDRWSLTERIGFLRLKACVPVYPGGFYSACNTLTQRLMGEGSVAEAMLSTENMAGGQYAGLCLLSSISLLIGAYMENGRKTVRYQYTRKLPLVPEKALVEPYSDDFFCEDVEEFTGDRIWLRLEHDGCSARLSFSLDGQEYKYPGEAKSFGFFAWRGGRVGLFCWNDCEACGCADFDWFHYKFR